MLSVPSYWFVGLSLRLLRLLSASLLLTHQTPLTILVRKEYRWVWLVHLVLFWGTEPGCEDG